MAALTHFPKTRLSELVKRFGGISRDDAVEAALQGMETMRQESDDHIAASISALEQLISAPADKAAYSPEQMREILHLCDQVVTLAGTFQYPALDAAARSLCDVTDGLLRAGRCDRASIMVHVRAIRMLAPGSAPLPPEQVGQVLSELAKVVAHHGFAKLSEAADRVALEEPR
jgi:hypothetical protein